jgi:hypothetical protein
MYSKASWLGMLPHPREAVFSFLRFNKFFFNRLSNEKEGFNIERFAVSGREVAIMSDIMIKDGVLVPKVAIHCHDTTFSSRQNSLTG